LSGNFSKSLTFNSEKIMATKLRRVDYFYTTIRDQPGEAYKILSDLEQLGINLLAITAVPIGPDKTQLTIFPEESIMLTDEAKKAGMKLDGPHQALLVQGDDKLGALAAIHMKLYKANVNIYASSGISNGKGGYGYILYIRPDQYDLATKALGV
jgi:hypothetical protein